MQEQTDIGAKKEHNPARRAVFDMLESPRPRARIGRLLSFLLMLLIALNVAAAILESVETLYADYQLWFDGIRIVSGLVFLVEYLLRLWVAVEHKWLRGKRHKRLRYALSPMALIDLVAILPMLLSFFIAMDLRMLRTLRLLRIFKLTRYSRAMAMLGTVLREEAGAFTAGITIMLVLLVLTASGAYLVENEVQPDKFGSIPAAMWWAVATLTTVGYGDVTPVTAMGKFFGAMVTIIGVGMAALPAGILASGMADQLQQARERREAAFRAALSALDDPASMSENLRRKHHITRPAARAILQQVQMQQGKERQNYCPHCHKPL